MVVLERTLGLSRRKSAAHRDSVKAGVESICGLKAVPDGLFADTHTGLWKARYAGTGACVAMEEA